MNNIPRREFLKLLALSLVLPSNLTAQAQYNSYKLPSNLISPNWSGDDYTTGHKMRDHEFEIKDIASSTTCDYVIVGGGISGLSTAWYLKDTNFILLEQYSQSGGQARGNSFCGIDYSYGSAYIYDTNSALNNLLKELKIDINQTQDQSLINDSNRNYFKNENKKLFEDYHEIFKNLEENKYQFNYLDSKIQKLDSQLFQEYLQNYSESYKNYLNSLLHLRIAGTSNTINALSAFMTISGIDRGVFKTSGQNKQIVEKLSDKLKNQIKNNCFVLSIKPAKKNSIIYYIDGESNIHEIKAKNVIISIIPMVASHLISDLSQEQTKALKSFKNASFIVGNIELNKNLELDYLSLLDQSYKVNGIIYNSNQEKTKAVLTTIMPFTAGGIGRHMILSDNKDEICSYILEDLTNALKIDISNNIENINLARWGHAMPVASQNYFARINKIKSLNLDSIIFNHSSLNGYTGFSQAILQSQIIAQNLKNKK